MDLIMTSDNTRDLFTENWNKWENAIIKYAAASKNKPAPLKHALRDVDGDSGIIIIFINVLLMCILIKYPFVAWPWDYFDFPTL